MIFTILILMLLNPFETGRAAPHHQSTSPEERAQALLSTLTPEERVGQLFLVTFNGTGIDEESPIYDLVTNHHIGGIVLQRDNDNFAPPPQTLNGALELTRQLQTIEWSASQTLQVDILSSEEFTPAFIPLFVAIAQEGDGFTYDQIFNGLTALPSQMALGATWRPDLARQVGTVLGHELNSLGITMLLGPSLDVLETSHQQGSNALGVRSFGGDPYWVGEMGRAYVAGLHEGSANRIAVVGKHFPGHGGSDRLPEEEVATVRKSLEQLKQIELHPFYAVTGNAPTTAATVDGLLASHIRYQGFQGNIRATTRPVSFDPQAFTQLMGLPEFASWRENGGVMISDNLGSRAFRRFIDPSGEIFNARFIARDAFLTGNDILFLGKGFIATDDPDSYISILRTLAFFAKKYREDSAFAQRVDISVFRILTLKYRIYDNIFTLDQVLPSENLGDDLGTYDLVSFDVAQEAATLINPSLVELAETLPEPPDILESIVFISDARTAQQCSQCPEQPILAKSDLEQAVINLYGPLAGGQVIQRNLVSYSYADLQAYLDSSEEINLANIENDLQVAEWIVFAMLDVNPDNLTSHTLSRFLAERPDIFQQKKLIVFAFNAPYFLDATEISKTTAYYGLYCKTPIFIEVAARLLFGEIPAPPGDLPVSVSGVGYDLISATSPNPEQIIPLYLDFPEPIVSEGTETPEPSPELEFRVGDLVPVRTGIILDHNGRQIPNFTPVQFILSGGTDSSLILQNETTQNGIARTTFLVDRSGTLEVRAESEPAMESAVLHFDIPPENGEESSPTPTSVPTTTPTQKPSPVITQTTPEATPQPPSDHQTGIGEWFIALVISLGIGIATFWLAAQSGLAIWGIRGGFLASSGGLLAYTYLALDMPGSKELLSNAGSWGVFLVTVIGSSLGWSAAKGWQVFQTNTKEKLSSQQSSEQT